MMPPSADDACSSPHPCTAAVEAENGSSVGFSPPVMGDLPLDMESSLRQKSPLVSRSSPPTSGLPLPPPPMTNHPTTNANQLAEAASKISLLSPDQFQLPYPTRRDLVKEESIISNSPPPPPIQTDSCHSPAPHKLELVQTASGNSSPSRELANILKEVG